MKAVFGSRKTQALMRFSVFLFLAALIAGMAGCVNAPTSPNPEIRTWYDLDNIRNYLADNYTLMNDLDSTTAGYQELASPTANAGKGWEPVGRSIGGHGPFFTGTFDGQGHEIHDLFINRPDEDSVGLFGMVFKDGVIKDIGVMNVTINGEYCVGVLAGSNGGTVANSHSTASVTGGDAVGGLVGWNSGTVIDSYFSGNVIGNLQVGGLTGTNPGTVSNSHSTGNVTGVDNVGGLVGYHADIVNNSYSSCNVTGHECVGGLAGYNYYGTVSNSYSAGNVTGYEDVGGLVGFNKGWAEGELNEGSVSDSYAAGSVTGDSKVGGLVGYNEYAAVKTCYSTGSVTGNADIGGLVGRNYQGSVYNSYWDIETSGQNTSAGIGARARNTTEMKDIATFSGEDWSGKDWNIVAVANPGERDHAYIWNIINNLTYPFLSWQPV